jgi:hypothetical protein
MALQLKVGLIILALIAVGWTSPCIGQTPPAAPAPGSPPSLEAQGAPPASEQPAPGSISGTVVDPTGAVVGGARVTLSRNSSDKDQSPTQEVFSGGNGQFFFASVPPGPFQLTVTSEGFTARTASGSLHPGEIYTVPQIILVVALNITDVEVALSRTEVAQEQVKDEEKQRVFGFIPNFYVTFDPHPVALTPKQKFELAWKTTVDPVTFGIVGAIAGVQQAQNAFSGYGQGAQGYAKRYGSTYANLVAGTFIGSAILPSLFKQDPRYFYKGSGSKRSRILYAIANSVICKGDNGHWQTNYSNIVGSLAAGALSNLYYPTQNRNGPALTFENTAIGIGATAAANLVEEFLMRKLTSNVSRDRTKP